MGDAGATLKLRLLGEPEVLRGNARIELPPSRKSRALLAYLVATSRAQRRERLCSMFWGLPDDPRSSLRWSLSRLRAIVDDPDVMRIIADRETVAFNPQGADIDLFAVRSLPIDRLGEVPTAELEQAALCFRGDFIEGLDLPDQHDFQSWCIAERGDWRRIHARLLRELVARHATKFEAALPHMRRLVEIEPYDQGARIDLLALLVSNGRRLEAESHFETAYRLLRDHDGNAAARFEWAWRKLARRTSRSTAEAMTGAPAEDSRAETASSEFSGAPRSQSIGFCTTSDGVRIAYALTGSGRPLVKTANWLNHLEYDWESPVWRGLFRQLSERYRLVRYDERGNGLSDWNAEDLSLDAFVRDFEAVVDAADLDRFPILGVSQGCCVAIEYAARHPERVTGMVLLNGFARGWKHSATPGFIAHVEAIKTLMSHAWGQDNPAFRQIYTSLFLPQGTTEQLNWFNTLQRITTSPENAVRLTDAFGSLDVRHRLPEVSVPTLVVHCRSDNFVPPSLGREIAAGIPGARFLSLESANHLLLESDPALGQFIAAAAAFLDEERA